MNIRGRYGTTYVVTDQLFGGLTQHESPHGEPESHA